MIPSLGQVNWPLHKCQDTFVVGKRQVDARILKLIYDKELSCGEYAEFRMHRVRVFSYSPLATTKYPGRRSE